MDKPKQTEFVPCTDIMRKYIKMMEQKLCTDSEEYTSSAHARREKIKCSEGKLYSYERFINWDNKDDPNIKQISAKKWISKKNCSYDPKEMANSEIKIDFKIMDSQGKELSSNIFQRAREYCKVWRYDDPYKVLEDYGASWIAVSCRADKVYLQYGKGIDDSSHDSYSGIGSVYAVEDITNSIPSMKPSK